MFATLLVLGSLCVAQTSDDAALKTEVRRLVKKLDADRLTDRQEAEDQLIKLGPGILKVLPEPSTLSAAEPKQRLARVRQKLQAASAEAGIQPSTVTLHAKEMKLSAVLAAIQQQTGNKLVDARGRGGPATDPTLAVDFEKTLFWTALDSVLDQAQVSIYPFGEPDTLQIVDRGPMQRPRTGAAVLSGPFRIEPVRTGATRELRTSGRASLLVTLEVTWEPRLQPIALRQRQADVVATDAAGHTIKVEDAAAQKEAFPRRGVPGLELETRLELPEHPLSEIATLRGTLQAMVPGKIETFRFNDLLHAKKVEQRIGAVTVTLDEVRKNDAVWEMYLHMALDNAGDALASHRSWVLENDAYLEGADGKPIKFDSMETTERTENEIGVGYLFALDDPPAKLALVYKTPGVIATKDFPFELKGVKLP